jgi:hypothetical protein
MRMHLLLLGFIPVFCSAVLAFAVTRYPDLNTTDTTPPFTIR